MVIGHTAARMIPGHLDTTMSQQAFIAEACTNGYMVTSTHKDDKMIIIMGTHSNNNKK
jgi:hypothetical protein